MTVIVLQEILIAITHSLISLDAVVRIMEQKLRYVYELEVYIMS